MNGGMRSCVKLCSNSQRLLYSTFGRTISPQQMVVNNFKSILDRSFSSSSAQFSIENIISSIEKKLLEHLEQEIGQPQTKEKADSEVCGFEKKVDKSDVIFISKSLPYEKISVRFNTTHYAKVEDYKETIDNETDGEPFKYKINLNFGVEIQRKNNATLVFECILIQNRTNENHIQDSLPDSVLNDSSAHQIKELDGTSCYGVETARIDLEDKNTYVQQFIPRLKDMATLVATLETLNYYYTTQCCGKFDHLEKNVHGVIDNLMVPNRITEKIKALCTKMRKELRCLYSEIRRWKSVYGCADYSSYFYLYGLVWDSSGHIDDKKTIEKALSSLRHWNDADFEFEKITKHCLVDYIMDFPLDSLSDEFIRKVEERQLFEHQLTYYWIKRKTRTKPIRRHDVSYKQYQFALTAVLNSLKHASSSRYQWSAYEYFWDCFDKNDQVEMTMNLIRNENYRKYQKILFSKLNKNQLKRLYSAAPLNIIVNFLSLGELELAKATWDRIKLTIECEKYELLLEQIWKNPKLHVKNRWQFSVYSWNTAPSNLIEYLINVKNCQIADTLLQGKPMLKNSSRCKFLKAVLSRTTLEFKQKFFLQTGRCLALNHPDVFISLIDHCLNESDSVAVRENLLIEAMENPPAGIMHRFRDLFLYSSREEFDKFLELFTSKPTLQTQFKQCLLASELLTTSVLWKTDYWEKLCQFIDELYPNREVARYQKRNVVFTFLRTHCTYHDCYRPNGDEKFTEIDNLLNQVLTPREVITAKENIANSFQRRYFRSLKRMNVLRFAKWCYCGDEEKIEGFRRSLPIDKLFRGLLSEIVERYVNSRDAELSFSSLDELLHWKFSSKTNEIKEFKSRELNKIMERKAEENHLWKTHIYPRVLKEVIEWVFHGDERQIREFEQRYSETDMMKIIHWMGFGEESDCCGEYYSHTSDESDGGRRHFPKRDDSWLNSDTDFTDSDSEFDEFDSDYENYLS
ncbi:uncharacterized protein LOC135846838 isoform X1 [Planococcus citri]|uniref:uncharacterized protein LOC135846838 isoform X1 n=1 Tax=Planococcus citri TaxID=170843 RepID=UPI0031F87125